MKKLFLTIFILTIFLFSCDTDIKSETKQNENIVLDPPVIAMEKEYIEGTVIIFDEVIQHANILNVKVNDEIIDDKSIKLDVGDYVITAFTTDKENRKSKEVLFRIKVYEAEVEKLIAIYSEPSETSEILKYVTESELSIYDIMRHEYIIEDDQFILWDAYVLGEDVIGYTISAYDAPLDNLDVAFYFDGRYEVITNDFPHAYRMKMENYYFYYRFGAISPDYYVRIINPISGEWVKFFVGIEDIIFNEEGNIFFVEEFHSETEPRDLEIQLFSLENDRIISLYNEKVWGHGFKNVKWNSNTEIEFDNYISGGIDFFDVSYQDLYSPQKLTIENDSVTKSEDNNQYEINKLRDDFMDKDEIILYEEISNQLKLIDKIHYSDIISSHFIRTFSFVDSEIVMWFKIKTKNGIEAYTYRKKKDNENNLIYDGYVLLDDNSILEVYDIGYQMRDYYKDLGYYLLEYFHRANYYTFISKDGLVNFSTNYDPIVSPSFHFIASTNLKADPYNSLEILAFNQLKAEKLYSVSLGEWSPKALEWISDSEIRLSAQRLKNESERIFNFYFLDGKWSSKEFTDAASSKYCVSIDVDVLNIRNNPGMDASIVEKAYYDTKYIVLDIQTDEYGDYWYKIDENQWIASKYCIFSFEF